MKVMIMAGGTGGHVFPGIAIAQALRARGVDVGWLGTQDGMEKRWVEQAGIGFDAISIKGLRGNGLAGWLKAPLNVARAWRQSRAVMRKQEPDLVLGMGGFVCGPGGLAAKSLGIKLVLHEQNAIPGLTNKLLAPLAEKVITAFPQNALKGPKVTLIGNPVREGLETVPVLEPVEQVEPCHLLILGGSRGALALNQTVPEALALMAPEERPSVTHQTGEKTLEEARKAYSKAGVQAEVLPFINDMVSAYAQADMVICRSGALTVSELMATARPAIMVPYPHAVDDHQKANAQALVDLGGGVVIEQGVLTAERLAEAIRSWCAQNERRVTASRAIRKGAVPRSTEKIVAVLMALSEKQE